MHETDRKNHILTFLRIASNLITGHFNDEGGLALGYYDEGRDRTKMVHARCFTGGNHKATFKTGARKARNPKDHFIVVCCFYLLFECNIMHYIKDSSTSPATYFFFYVSFLLMVWDKVPLKFFTNVKNK